MVSGCQGKESSQCALPFFCAVRDHPCNEVGNRSGSGSEDAHLEAVQAEQLERGCANVAHVISHVFPGVPSHDVH